MAFINLLRWEIWYNNYSSSEIFIRSVLTNFDMLEQFLGLVRMQSTAIGFKNKGEMHKNKVF